MLKQARYKFGFKQGSKLFAKILNYIKMLLDTDYQLNKFLLPLLTKNHERS